MNDTKVEGITLALHSDAFDVKSRTGPKRDNTMVMSPMNVMASA